MSNIRFLLCMTLVLSNSIFPGLAMHHRSGKKKHQQNQSQEEILSDAAKSPIISQLASSYSLENKLENRAEIIQLIAQLTPNYTHKDLQKVLKLLSQHKQLEEPITQEDVYVIVAAHAFAYDKSHIVPLATTRLKRAFFQHILSTTLRDAINQPPALKTIIDACLSKLTSKAIAQLAQKLASIILEKNAITLELNDFYKAYYADSAFVPLNERVFGLVINYYLEQYKQAPLPQASIRQIHRELNSCTSQELRLLVNKARLYALDRADNSIQAEDLIISFYQDKQQLLETPEIRQYLLETLLRQKSITSQDINSTQAAQILPNWFTIDLLEQLINQAYLLSVEYSENLSATHLYKALFDTYSTTKKELKEIDKQEDIALIQAAAIFDTIRNATANISFDTCLTQLRSIIGQNRYISNTHLQDIQTTLNHATQENNTFTEHHLYRVIEQKLNSLNPKESRLVHNYDLSNPTQHLADIVSVPQSIRTLVDHINTQRETTNTITPTLLYGPPGTGKTTLVKAIAGQTEIPLLYLSAAHVVTRYQGSGSKTIRKIFKRARSLNRRVIVFIDEIHVITHAAHTTNNHSQAHSDACIALQEELDDLATTNSRIIFIAATNFYDQIAQPIRSRFGENAAINIPLPGTTARRQLFRLYMQQQALQDLITHDLINSVASLTSNMSGRVIKHIVDRVKQQAHPTRNDVYIALYYYKETPLTPDESILMLRCLARKHRLTLTETEIQTMAHEAAGCTGEKVENALIQARANNTQLTAQFYTQLYTNTPEKIPTDTAVRQCIFSCLLAQERHRLTQEHIAQLATYSNDLTGKEIQSAIAHARTRARARSRTRITVNDCVLGICLAKPAKNIQLPECRLLLNYHLEHRQHTITPEELEQLSNRLITLTCQHIKDVVLNAHKLANSNNRPICNNIITMALYDIALPEIQHRALTHAEIINLYSYYAQARNIQVTAQDIASLAQKLVVYPQQVQANRGIIAQDVKHSVNRAAELAAISLRQTKKDDIYDALHERNIRIPKDSTFPCCDCLAFLALSFLSGLS